MSLYGLTCGFWSDKPDDVDTHTLQHHVAGKAENLYDLFDDQAPEAVILRDCSEGVPW